MAVCRRHQFNLSATQAKVALSIVAVVAFCGATLVVVGKMWNFMPLYKIIHSRDYYPFMCRGYDCFLHVDSSTVATIRHIFLQECRGYKGNGQIRRHFGIFSETML